MIQYRVVHATEYCFEKPVGGFNIVARLRPLESPRQSCDFFQLACRPTIDLHKSYVDTFGNHVSVFNIAIQLQRLLISAVSTVSVDLPPCPEKLDVSSSAHHVYTQPTVLTPGNEEIASFSRELVPAEIKPSEAASILSRFIHDNFRFSHDVSDVRTTAVDVLRQRSGVCQDFAHLAIAVLRSSGVPSRYISGYLHSAAFREKAHRIASDVSHAWFEVYDPVAGWTGFDPTNGCRVDGNYITVARGRDYNDICPLQGTYEGAAPHTIRVSVDVQYFQ